MAFKKFDPANLGEKHSIPRNLHTLWVAKGLRASFLFKLGKTFRFSKAILQSPIKILQGLLQGLTMHLLKKKKLSMTLPRSQLLGERSIATSRFFLLKFGKDKCQSLIPHETYAPSCLRKRPTVVLRGRKFEFKSLADKHILKLCLVYGHVKRF